MLLIVYIFSIYIILFHSIYILFHISYIYFIFIFTVCYCNVTYYTTCEIYTKIAKRYEVLHAYIRLRIDTER